MPSQNVATNSDLRRLRLSFDVGGTFTDFTLLDERAGKLHFHKVPSTPHDPSQAIGQGIADLTSEHRIEPAELVAIGHGSTVATNMIIERRGASTALLTTRGFRDVIEIGRQTRPNLYDYSVLKPEPLVSREWRFEIDERVTAGGEVLVPLDLTQVEAAARKIADAGIEAVAICFLHSYRFPDHETKAREILQKVLGDAVYVSASSDVLPEFREYERASTTVINATLGPRMTQYMTNLSRSTAAKDIRAAINTVHSNGGLMSVQAVCSAPVRTCLSGPAAGVVGACEVGRIAGFENLITFDVGGTSTDVSLIRDARALFTTSRLVADYPVKSQMIDVHVIGAGGGSIAAIDRAGALKVGPRSAGAFPGPIAYGRGGGIVTVTDAHVCLGRLNPVSVLGGRMKIHAEAAREAMARQIAEPLGLSVEEAAIGILQIANANMARAVRSVSTERGLNIRDFALCSFGGAGGLHAAELARDCQIDRILIPQEPGTMCARGILLSNTVMDFVRTLLVRISETNWEAIRGVLDTLHAAGSAWLESEGIAREAWRFHSRIEARYDGQNYEIPVDFDFGEIDSLAEFTKRFQAAHLLEYGYDPQDTDIEIVNCRVQAVGLTPHAEMRPITAVRSLDAARIGTRQAYFDDAGWAATTVYDRDLLPVGDVIAGPAIVEEMSSTTVILPGQSAQCDRFGNLIVSTSASEARS